MNPDSQQLIHAILWLAPVILTLATLGLLSAAYSLRRNLGAQNLNAGVLILTAIVVLALHAGYFLAPLWWRSGRCLLGAATMLPVALFALGTIAIIVGQTQIVSDMGRWSAPNRVAVLAGTGLVVFAYLGPLVLMIVGSA